MRTPTLLLAGFITACSMAAEPLLDEEIVLDDEGMTPVEEVPPAEEAPRVVGDWDAVEFAAVQGECEADTSSISGGLLIGDDLWADLNVGMQVEFNDSTFDLEAQLEGGAVAFRGDTYRFEVRGPIVAERHGVEYGSTVEGVVDCEPVSDDEMICIGVVRGVFDFVGTVPLDITIGGTFER